MPKIYVQQFTDESEEAKAFYEAIGRNVVLWGRLETTIADTMLRILHHPLAQFPKPVDWPRSFGQSIELWKAIFKKEPLVAIKKPRALAFASAAKTLAKRRNKLIHSSIGHFDGATQGAVASVLGHRGQDTTLEHFRLLTSDLNQLVCDTEALHLKLQPVSIGILLLAASRQAFVHSPRPAEAASDSGSLI